MQLPCILNVYNNICVLYATPDAYYLITILLTSILICSCWVFNINYAHEYAWCKLWFTCGCWCLFCNHIKKYNILNIFNMELLSILYQISAYQWVYLICIMIYIYIMIYNDILLVCPVRGGGSKPHHIPRPYHQYK